MRYRIAILLFSASVFAGIGAVAGYITSFNSFDHTVFSTPFAGVVMLSEDGGLSLTTEPLFGPDNYRSYGVYRSLLGFGYGSRIIATRSDWQIHVPYWSLMMLCLVVATGALRYARRRMRVARDSARGQICPNCEYDLRGTPDRCPECGWRSVEALLRRTNERPQ